MKVILKKDMPSIGKKFEVKEVSDGYALNFLLPQKLAEMATPQGLKEVEKRKQQAEAEKNIQAELLLKNLESLKDGIVTIKEKVNEKGHLFASIHEQRMAEEVKKQLQIDILPEFIKLSKPIKGAGEYEIEVKVKDQVTTFKLVVEEK